MHCVIGGFIPNNNKGPFVQILLQILLENSPKKAQVLIGLKLWFYGQPSKNCRRNDGESKEKLHFDDQSKQLLFSFFFWGIFEKK